MVNKITCSNSKIVWQFLQIRIKKSSDVQKIFLYSKSFLDNLIKFLFAQDFWTILTEELNNL